MKDVEKTKALKLRSQGHSIREISSTLGVAKSSVSVWVRDIVLTNEQVQSLKGKGYTNVAIEKRRASRLTSEEQKRRIIIDSAKKDIVSTSLYELKLMGTMLYWAEGGKTQRTVRFSNGDPKMIQIMMKFFRLVCMVPEHKLRGYIHIHPHLDHIKSEEYWSDITGIPVNQFFKTYRKINISSKNKRKTLPYGVLDIYILDTKLFFTITGWADEIFNKNS